ncbi:hypothetical protein NUW54_g11554 [Trametes sanguinea]|uniref:Uncharacterized protein n=1 Tax=Trametes sanguinea TaxID=158606 RepID=A0ACC1NB35_9APHY|nr:hypothetical protein NUW54_g11554 [Trametes sanguinea]
MESPGPRLFSNVDVLCEIAEWVVCRHDSPHERRQDLARLARVCQAFHEPAVRVLWRELDTIYHLFLVLPSFVLRRRNAEPSPQSTHERPYDEYHLPANIPSFEWERLRRYAAYVRTVTFYNRTYHGSQWVARRWGRMELSRDGWSCIKCYFADRPVFPNLRNLRWQLVEADFEIGSVVHFLSPSLRTLEFSCRNTSRNAVAQQSLDTWSERLRLVVDDISTRVPRLAKLILSYSGSLTAAQFLTPLSLTSHPFLRHLTLEGSPDKALEFPDIVILSRIPQLESLMLNGGHHASQGISNPSESGHTQSQHVEFPRLRSLHFLNLLTCYATVESATLIHNRRPPVSIRTEVALDVLLKVVVLRIRFHIDRESGSVSTARPEFFAEGRILSITYFGVGGVLINLEGVVRDCVAPGLGVGEIGPFAASVGVRWGRRRYGRRPLGFTSPHSTSTIAFPDSCPGKLAQITAVTFGFSIHGSMIAGPTECTTTTVFGFALATASMSGSALIQSVKFFLSPSFPSTVI